MRPGRLCAQLALACFLAGGGAAAQTGGSPEWLVVRPGQSATEIALDQVPAGTTIDQFLLALYQLNPQAFAAGDLHRLMSQVRLRLPTAEEANEVAQAEARAQLARLRAGQPLAEAPAALAAAPAVAPSERATEPAAALPQDATESPGSAWAAWAAAALGLMGLMGWRSRRRPQTIHAASAPCSDLEAQAQGRFQPVLPSPAGAQPPGRWVPDPDNSSSANDRPEGRARTGGARPALFDLDLNLEGKAPAPDLGLAGADHGTPSPRLPRRSGLPDLDPAPTAPARAPTPGPLDLSGLSLDLEPPPKGRP